MCMSNIQCSTLTRDSSSPALDMLPRLCSLSDPPPLSLPIHELGSGPLLAQALRPPHVTGLTLLGLATESCPARMVHWPFVDLDVQRTQRLLTTADPISKHRALSIADLHPPRACTARQSAIAQQRTRQTMAGAQQHRAARRRLKTQNEKLDGGAGKPTAQG